MSDVSDLLHKLICDVKDVEEETEKLRARVVALEKTEAPVVSVHPRDPNRKPNPFGMLETDQS